MTTTCSPSKRREIGRAHRARAVRDGQDRADGIDPLLRRPFSVFEVLRDDGGTRPRRSASSTSASARTTGLLYDARSRRRRVAASARSAGRSSAAPAARRGWWPAASAWRRSPRSPKRWSPRGVPTTLFYGARTGEELFYLEFFERLGVDAGARTEDGSAATQGRVTGAARARARRPLDGPAVHDLRVRPRADAGARWRRLAARYGQPCEVSVERMMGCGLGGCYSCVVPVKHDDGQHRTTCARASAGRCSTAPPWRGTDDGIGSVADDRHARRCPTR